MAVQPWIAEQFVGRHSELAVLQAHIEMALAGTGSVALLSGEARVGKPRLDTELADRFSVAALHAQAEAWGSRGLQLAREIGWRAGEAYALSNLGELLVSAGRYGEALAELEAAIEISEEIDHREWLTGSSAIRGHVQRDPCAGPSLPPPGGCRAARARKLITPLSAPDHRLPRGRAGRFRAH